MADDYAFPKGELMRGKKGLVMGVANHNSIAWGIASQLAAQGAEMAFTYQGEELERRVRPLAESIGVKTMIPADVTDDASMDAAFAAFNLASLLVKGSQEEGCIADRRAMLVERAVGLTLEACSVACAKQEHDQGADLVSEILAALDAEEVLANRAADAQMQRLKDAFLEAVGEEWEPLTGEEGEEGEEGED